MTVRWTVRAAEDRARSSRENRVPAKNVAEATPARILTALIPPPIKSPCTTNAYFVRGATDPEFARLLKRLRNYTASGMQCRGMTAELQATRQFARESSP